MMEQGVSMRTPTYLTYPNMKPPILAIRPRKQALKVTFCSAAGDVAGDVVGDDVGDDVEPLRDKLCLEKIPMIAC